MLHNINPAWETADAESAVAAAERLISELRGEGHPVVSVPVSDDNLIQRLQAYHPNDYVVFNWCEELPGQPHSDAAVAEILESLHFAYTGSPPQVLSFSWDKAATKALLQDGGIQTPVGRVMETTEIGSWDRFPAIVKPAREHCSFGISADAVVVDRGELKDRITFIHDNFRQPALVEEFIDGREIHITLWGNGDVRPLPAAEMDFSAFESFKDRLCTFDSKFTPGSAHYEKIELRVPALLDEAELSVLNRTSKQAYQTLGCRDYARIDLRMGDGLFYVLDVNPNADLSADTSMVYAAEAAGFSYGAFASWLVNLAAQRHPIFSREA